MIVILLCQIIPQVAKFLVADRSRPVGVKNSDEHPRSLVSAMQTSAIKSQAFRNRQSHENARQPPLDSADCSSVASIAPLRSVSTACQTKKPFAEIAWKCTSRTKFTHSEESTQIGSSLLSSHGKVSSNLICDVIHDQLGQLHCYWRVGAGDSRVSL